jgi:hypothetical protein
MEDVITKELFAALLLMELVWLRPAKAGEPDQHRVTAQPIGVD